VELAGAVCLVTGASSGIGRAVAVRLGRAGAHVVVSGRDEGRLREAAREAGAHPIAADLTLPGEAERLAAAAAAPFGPIDVLVNNAGAGWAGPFAEMAAGEIGRLFAVNAVAPVILTRALLRTMLERRRGHVVNVASIAGHVGARREAVYAATKGAVAVFSESLRQELAGTGVGVTLVSPGVVATSFFDRRGAPYARRRPRPLPPERVAEALVEAVVHDRPLVIVPRWLALPVGIHGLLPSVYRRLATRFG
jgi:short-subunit dehydrogenase